MVFTAIWIAIIIVSLAFRGAEIETTIKDSQSLLLGLRPRHFLIGLGSFTATAITAAILLHFIPPLRFGWGIWLAGYIENSSGITTSTDSGINYSIPLWLPIMAIIGVVIFALFIPKLAYEEELSFRFQLLDEPLKAKLLGSLRFGLLHLVMGIPIGAGLALAVAGLIFTFVAQKEYDKQCLQLEQELADKKKKIAESNYDYYSQETKKVIEDIDTTVEQCYRVILFRDARFKAVKESGLAHAAHNYLVAVLLVLLLGILLVAA